MTLDEAVDVVARSDEWDWEDYPEIGEDDWDRVLRRVVQLLPPAPKAAEFTAAYDFLTERGVSHLGRGSDA